MIHIPALVTATLNIQELQGSPEYGEQGSIIGDGFRFQFLVQNELHISKIEARVGVDLCRCSEVGHRIGVRIRAVKVPSEPRSGSKSVGFSEISG